MKKLRKPKKKPQKKGAQEEAPAQPTGPIYKPIDEQMRDLIRSERFEERQEGLLEIERIQRGLASKQPPMFLSTQKLENAYLMPIDEVPRDEYGDGGGYMDIKDSLMVNPNAKSKKGKKKKK